MTDQISTAPATLHSDQNNSTIDLLGRDKWLNNVEVIINSLSDRKASCTFAVTAPWGTGKTFALNLLEQRLLNENNKNRYMVFQYNCWKYDFYEEPLIAIVAAFLDFYDKKGACSEKARDKIKKVFAFTKRLATEFGYSLVKSMTKLDLDKVLEMFESAFEESEKIDQDKADRKSYDIHITFQKAIQAAQNAIAELAKDYTMVILVDELDRCLPEYAIKVLERLHHLFFGVQNTLVLLSIDDKQLEHTVRQIYGSEESVDNYLKKFIQFRIPMPKGKYTHVSEYYENKFPGYFSLFNKDLIPSEPNYGFGFWGFYEALFWGIDMRTQERIIEKLEIVHSILFPAHNMEEKKDYSVLCFELIWTVLKCELKITLDKNPIHYNPMASGLSPRFTLSDENAEKAPKLASYLRRRWSDSGILRSNNRLRNSYILPESPYILHLILYYFSELSHDSEATYELHPATLDIERYRQNVKDLRTFTNFLDSIL